MKLHEDWLFRGLIHQTTDDGVFERLDTGGVIAYIGFDPTAPSLHLGHLLPLCNLRRLQLGGNTPIALAGGGTGLVGDPSFKDTERPLLTLEQLQVNLAGIREQMGRLLDFSPSAGASQRNSSTTRTGSRPSRSPTFCATSESTSPSIR